MESLVQQEYQQLKMQLQHFIEQARENEVKMQRFHEQELRLISSRSLAELIKNIIVNYRSAFSLSTVSLLLFDPKYELQHYLEDDMTASEPLQDLLFCSEKLALDNQFKLRNQPYLGEYDSIVHRSFFRQPVFNLKSIALLPLVRYDELIGSLNLGSDSSSRFKQDSATDFLQRLSTIVAICIENSANHERLKRVGLTDSLTGINNRRFFDQRLGEEIARGIRNQEQIACLFLDIDHFKKINDVHGHHTGDQVLRETAIIIREQLRNNDVLSRYGGEEFSVILANTSLDTALEIAERIRVSIQNHAFHKHLSSNSESLKSTISIGVAALNMKFDTHESAAAGKILLEQADQALYDAKKRGRNCVMTSQSHNS